MNDLQINLTEGKNAFDPGAEVTGTVEWRLEKPPRAMELRLFWFTRGKGTEDAGVAETVRFDQLALEETRSFSLRLPEAPYSFSGKLISLVWALELISEPSKAVARVEITVAPGGREILLAGLPRETSKRKILGFTVSQ